MAVASVEHGAKIDKRRPFAPVHGVFAAYWNDERASLVVLLAVVVFSSIASIAAPYLSSRLIDGLPDDNLANIIIGFLIYALLLGMAGACQTMIQYLSFMSAENLGFIFGT